MSIGSDLIRLIAGRHNLDDYQKKHWTGSFSEYLDIIRQDPKVTRTAYQRIYDMITSYGTEEVLVNKEKVLRYKFFEDPDNHGEDAIFGLERTLTSLVNILMSAANGYGTERRVLLLHGPVGSSKSTLARLLKKGLEQYSRRDEGALYTFGWREVGPDGEETFAECPMHEEPLHLIPHEDRAEVNDYLNRDHGPDDFHVVIDGGLCPFCRQMFNERLELHGGDWSRVVEDVRARRLTLSEQDRIGVGTFQPKDEKNQDATELSGDINYRKIAEYGTVRATPERSISTASSTSPTAASSNSSRSSSSTSPSSTTRSAPARNTRSSPKSSPRPTSTRVIIGHTNEPEYKKLQSNEFMEALRRPHRQDRRVPYVTRLNDEVKIYEKDYNSRKVKGSGWAPHTLEVAGDVGRAHAARGAEERRADADAEAQAL